MASLSTHVLDTSIGSPARNLKLSLNRIRKKSKLLIGSFETNCNGRVDRSLSDNLKPGIYELIFDTESYFQTSNHSFEDYFFDEISIRFIVTNPDDHYHVPLLLSPFGYSTYRGS